MNEMIIAIIIAVAVVILGFGIFVICAWFKLRKFKVGMRVRWIIPDYTGQVVEKDYPNGRIKVRMDKNDGSFAGEVCGLRPEYLAILLPASPFEGRVQTYINKELGR